MEQINQILDLINHYLWGLPMIFLLLGTHLFMTLKTGFIQRKVFLGIRLSFSPEKASDGDISPFAALSTALASTLGTGNIIGVGTAISLGGPGAVFWCWLTGILGIATSYAESLLALKYRVRTPDGAMQGGAMYVLEQGLHAKWLGKLFALFGVLTSFGIGCAIQVSSISSTLSFALSENTKISLSWLERLLYRYPQALSLTVGIFSGILASLVFFGGFTSVSKICERLVPFMTLFYLSGCTLILFQNRHVLPDTLLLILKSAFTKTSALGGLTGSGILLAARYGIARGLFSNEAGMGSAAIVSAAARCKNPVRQALIASTAPFWDTVVVCLITGLVLVSSLLKGGFSSSASLSGSTLTYAAFSQIPLIGQPLLLLGITTFAYATILGWSYYGEQCLHYLWGKQALFLYRFFFILTLVLAPVFQIDFIFQISDLFNALMALPNLAALLALAPVIEAETKEQLRTLC